MPYSTKVFYFCPKCQKNTKWNGITPPKCQICGSVDCRKCSDHPVIVCKDCFQKLPLKTQNKLNKMKRRSWGSVISFLVLLFVGFFGIFVPPNLFPQENLDYRNSLIDLLKYQGFWLAVGYGIAFLICPFMMVFIFRYARYKLDPSLVQEPRSKNFFEFETPTY